MIRATQTTILRVCEREATTYLVLLVPSHLNITIDGPEETLLPVGEGKRSAHRAVYSQQEPLFSNLLMGALGEMEAGAVMPGRRRAIVCSQSRETFIPFPNGRGCGGGRSDAGGADTGIDDIWTGRVSL